MFGGGNALGVDGRTIDLDAGRAPGKCSLMDRGMGSVRTGPGFAMEEFGP